MKPLVTILTVAIIATLSLTATAATQADIVGNWYAYRDRPDMGFGIGCNYEFRADGTLLLNAAINGSTPYAFDENTTLPMEMMFLIIAPGTWTFDGTTLETDYDGKQLQFELVSIYLNNDDGKADESTVNTINMVLNSEEMRAEFKKEMEGELTSSFNGEIYTGITFPTPDTMRAVASEGDTVDFERR